MGPGSRVRLRSLVRDDTGVSSRFNRHAVSGYASAFSRRDASELCVDFHPLKTRGRRESRVRAAPAVSRAIVIGEKRTRAYRFSGEHPAFPAQWFYGLLRDLPGEASSLATVTSRISPPSLAPASGARTSRLRRPLKSRSSVATFASTASHRAFVTTCDPPLSSGETGETIVADLPDGLSGIFLREGMDERSACRLICLDGLFCRGLRRAIVLAAAAGWVERSDTHHLTDQRQLRRAAGQTSGIQLPWNPCGTRAGRAMRATGFAWIL